MSRAERAFPLVLTNKKFPNGNCFLLFSKYEFLRRALEKADKREKSYQTRESGRNEALKRCKICLSCGPSVYKKRMLMNRNDP
ncbi:hypothetical protein AD952_08730 [Acetobacter cerevisiae]|uniref:Uncharacterized protein n=1 Tax=Acetobacter cerevisiae TaxID=178900 RepID=A0A149UUH1_9PROT|nr:hypothetical protein AD952_08730 [Acetobacter cerevisiae]